MNFEVTPEDHIKIADWLDKEIWPNGQPYGGAIGGAVTYQFTPTSLGVVFKVIVDDNELDLTEYNLW